MASLDERATGTTTASLCGFGKREGEEMDIVGALRDGEEELDWEEDPEEKRLASRKSGRLASGIGKMRLVMRRNGGADFGFTEGRTGGRGGASAPFL